MIGASQGSLIGPDLGTYPTNSQTGGIKRCKPSSPECPCICKSKYSEDGVCVCYTDKNRVMHSGLTCYYKKCTCDCYCSKCLDGTCGCPRNSCKCKICFIVELEIICQKMLAKIWS